MQDIVINYTPEEVDKMYENNEFVIPKLMLQAPPRHGKTDMVSRFLPAYFLGKYPQYNIRALSGGIGLAVKNNRDVQAIMMSDKFIELFGSLLNKDRVVTKDDLPRRNMDLFEIIKDGNIMGSYSCATVGGNIMGTGCNLLIIDDPIKNDEMANSNTQKDSLEDWFYNTAMSRVEIPFIVIVMHQRWAVDDLCGRLLNKKEGVQWRSLKFKAIQDDGTALIPELVPLFRLKEARDTMPNFDAMYQQNPVLRGGNIIKTDRFKYYELEQSYEKTFIIGDTALSSKTSADYSVFGYFGILNNNLYLIDILRGKWDLTEIIQRLKIFADHHDETKIYIESGSAGTPLRQLMHQKGIPSMTLTPKSKDKYTRVQIALPYIDEGFVHLKKGATWTHEFLSECEQFTDNDSHPNDDQVDVLVYGVEILRTSKKTTILEPMEQTGFNPFVIAEQSEWA